MFFSQRQAALGCRVACKHGVQKTCRSQHAACKWRPGAKLRRLTIKCSRDGTGKRPFDTAMRTSSARYIVSQSSIASQPRRRGATRCVTLKLRNHENHHYHFIGSADAELPGAGRIAVDAVELNRRVELRSRREGKQSAVAAQRWWSTSHSKRM